MVLIFYCRRQVLGLLRFINNAEKSKSFFFISTNGCTIYLLRSTLKFTLKFILKLLLHSSVQQPSSGSILLSLAKVIIIKTIVKIRRRGLFGDVAAYYVKYVNFNANFNVLLSK